MRLIVIGGGAAGFFCAVTAARMNPEAKVIILERTGKLLSKVRISGGGRCNVTHACFSIPDILRNYPRGEHFVKKAFHQFFTTDTVSWFLERKVLLKTEPDGRMFPVSDRSESIVDCLMEEASRYQVEIRLHADVKSLVRRENSWKIGLADGNAEEADSVCIACGGYPKADMFGWMEDAGHSVQPPVPSLFTFNIPGHEINTLMGISKQAKLRIPGIKKEETGNVLITHWGLSGPAVLRLSARAARELADCQYRFTVSMNWCPEHGAEELRAELSGMRDLHPSRKVNGKNGWGVPQRLWEWLCRMSGVKEEWNWADLPGAVLQRLLGQLTAQEFRVSGKTTFKEEFVTSGGIKLSEVDPNTMKSRLIEGLYFAGEVLDVDGVTGGFNFQHAWTSGWIAGKNMANFCIFAPPN